MLQSETVYIDARSIEIHLDEWVHGGILRCARFLNSSLAPASGQTQRISIEAALLRSKGAIDDVTY